MPLEFENTGGGATDISGQPDPVRTPGSLKGDTNKKINQNERRPQAQPSGDNPVQGAAQAVGNALGSANQSVAQWGQDQGLATPKRSLNPLDWAGMMEQDASTVWGWSRQAYRTMQGAYHDGVTNLYAGQDARAKVGQSAAEFAAYAMPFNYFNQALSTGGNLKDLATGQESVDQFQQRQRGEGEQAVLDAPGAAVDSATMALPMSVAGRVAQLGVPLVEQLLGGNPDDQDSALAWAGVGAILSFGHVPEPMRRALSSRFGDWSKVEERVAAATGAARSAARGAPDPARRSGAVQNWIEEQLSRGAMAGGYAAKPVARAASETGTREVRAEVTREGAIRLLETESRKGLKKLLARVGVEDVDELVHKIQTQGITDPKVIKGIEKHWKDLGLKYDLKRFHPDETPLRDPRRLMDSVADSKAAFGHVNAVNQYLDQIHRGLFASASNPMQAVMRALAGHNRTSQLAHQSYLSSVVSLLGEKGLTAEAQKSIMRAAEGDEEAYKNLRPEEQMVVDSWGLIRAATRQASEGTQYASNFVPNWVPRTDRAAEDMLRGRGRPSRARVLSRESRAHREESLQAGPGGQIVLGQRFKTVTDANKALAAARSNLVDTLVSTEKGLSAELMNDPEARSIKAIASTDPDAAMERARRLASQKYPDKESNFLLNVNRVLGNQVRSIHTHQALNEFLRMKGKDGRAAALQAKSQRQREEFIRQGYQTIDDPRFSGHVFHPDLAKDLNRYVNHVSKGLRDAPVWKQALQLEGKAVAAIMFSPLVHGLNVAGRMGMASMMNPLEMAAYLTKGRNFAQAHELDDLTWSLRSEAYNAGLIPHFQHQNYADTLLSQMQDALGDVEERMPKTPPSPTKANRLRQMIDDRPRPLTHVNNYFWGKVNDFGVMMFHLEKAAASKRGMAPEAATEYAARRANSWMGSVAPEDTNPMLHDLSRLVMFAPNWWRTWAELMVPLYKRAGFTEDPVYLRHAAYQSAKTISAAFAFQKLTGNALNYMMSGHLQNQNQPGSQDKVEIARPEILSMLKDVGVLPAGIDPQTGIDSKTGGIYTMENPLARQQLATETALGLQSGQPDWQPSDLSDGMTRFLASRVSPIFDSAMGALNVDMYQSVHDGQLRAVNPEQRALSISPANMLYGALMMVPGGRDFADAVNRQASSGNTTPVESVLGTKVPKSLQDSLAAVTDPASRLIFSALTGVNPAYETAAHTRGQKPSDQDYQRAKALTDEYHRQMNLLSAQTLSGQMSPSQWRAAYQDLSRAHTAQMDALFKGSPDYVNGAEGMAAQWEALYDKPNVTRPDGTVDYDQLTIEQARFRQSHSSEQMQQMTALLHQNDTQYPMLALYHKTQQQFSSWQETWAQQHNVDVSALRKETGEYGSLYGDSRGQRQYLAQHPELRAYEAAKKREFDRSMAGMMHALFYGQNANVLRYLRAHRLTQSEFASEQAA